MPGFFHAAYLFCRPAPEVVVGRGHARSSVSVLRLLSTCLPVYIVSVKITVAFAEFQIESVAFWWCSRIVRVDLRFNYLLVGFSYVLQFHSRCFVRIQYKLVFSYYETGGIKPSRFFWMYFTLSSHSPHWQVLPRSSFTLAVWWGATFRFSTRRCG